MVLPILAAFSSGVLSAVAVDILQQLIEHRLNKAKKEATIEGEAHKVQGLKSEALGEDSDAQSTRASDRSGDEESFMDENLVKVPRLNLEKIQFPSLEENLAESLVESYEVEIGINLTMLDIHKALEEMDDMHKRAERLSWKLRQNTLRETIQKCVHLEQQMESWSISMSEETLPEDEEVSLSDVETIDAEDPVSARIPVIRKQRSTDTLASTAMSNVSAESGSSSDNETPPPSYSLLWSDLISHDLI